MKLDMFFSILNKFHQIMCLIKLIKDKLNVDYIYSIILHI